MATERENAKSSSEISAPTAKTKGGGGTGPMLPRFHHAEAYPDATSIFGMVLAPLKDIKDEALVVLDTNVLLVPYTINSKSLDAIRTTYKHLKDEQRLFVPSQVAREFAVQRANKLGEIFTALSRKRDELSSPELGKYPLLEGLEEYTRLRKLEREIGVQLKEYRKELDSIVKQIQAWRWDDPVSAMYGELFTADVVTEIAGTREETEKFLAHRQENRLAPGYKDAAKQDGGVGDALIWRTILDLGSTKHQDVIFVSFDEKPDWWHRSDKTALYPRFDLANEFWRVSGGCTFHQIRFSDLLELFQAPNDVVAEVRQEEAIAQVPLKVRRDDFGDAIATVAQRVRSVLATRLWLTSRFQQIVTTDSDLGEDYLAYLPKGMRLGIEVKNFYPAGKSRLSRHIKEAMWQADSTIRTGSLDALIIIVVADDEVEAVHAKNVALNSMFWESTSETGEQRIGIVIGYLNSSDRLLVVWEHMPRVLNHYSRNADEDRT